MNKFGIIVAHTYLSRLKTKSFLITTALTIALIFLAGNIQSIMSLFEGNDNEVVAVKDDSNEILADLKKEINTIENPLELEKFSGSNEAAMNKVHEGEYEGFLHVSITNGLPEGHYYSLQGNPSSITNTIQQGMQPIKLTMAADNAGVDPSTVESITSPVSFETTALEADTKSAAERDSARGLVYVMLFLLYISVIMYGNMIALDVAIEKSSRVMEILVSSVPAITQMFAKIVGIALLGFTQFLTIILVAYFVIQSKQEELTGGVFEYFGLQGATASTFIYALIFFLLGYLLYATLSAMLGSLVSRTEDVNQLMAPVIYLIMIAFFIAIYGLSSPDSTIVTVTSFIPFFTPMIMFLRVTMLHVPIWEIVLSFGLMIAVIVILAVIGGKVYKGGVLMYGKSNSLKDLTKALQLSKKE
ncbi:ABC transporter permease [Salibacterium salarium]|uniref:ABC transporter permease n=1 Tax=Salibacterium salarium TaxID=284579 RepID=A0A3R9WUB5_9BACI|nr:ABC transporter permease [Salibacterium salarium]RSL33703.1 ABC transporter permease [Salibacterium salarium]